MPARKTREKPSAKAPAASPGASGAAPLLLLFLLVAVAGAYYPAWHGGVLWDDNAHLIPPELRTLSGLWRMWFDFGTTQQYYPLVYSAFWVQARLWGDNYLPYHLLNIALHATTAYLLFVLLRRLAVPGARIAAVLFALHPVAVESVAWMTELKNTMSGTWYLASALTYLTFDRTRRRTTYALALGFFVLALTSKTVTCTLPAGLLVVMWWLRGRVDWRRDVVPLVPYFILGAAAALTTSWYERTFVGAVGQEFALTFVERVLVAGRAFFFYLWTLLAPFNLIFIYPRWTVSATAWWQYLFPVGAIALLAVAWRVREWSRAPLAALLWFGVTVSPALGFVNVYPLRYSFVADHFQYLASIGILTLVAGALMWLTRRRMPRLGEPALIAILGVPLLVLTWQQAGQYRDAETLYRTTLARNPEAWLAHDNLATLLVRGTTAQRQEALEHYQEAVRLMPTDGALRDNLATTLVQMGLPDEALRQQQEAVRLAPRYAQAHVNLGVDLQRVGQLQAAEAEYRTALALSPSVASTHARLGSCLAQMGRVDEGLQELRLALALDSRSTEARTTLADVLSQVGQTAEAEGLYRGVLAQAPDDANAHLGLGILLFRAASGDDAEVHLRAAVRLDPQNPLPHDALGLALQSQGRFAEAVPEHRRAIDLESGSNLSSFHNDLGAALAGLGERDEAIAEFREALRLDPTLAAASDNLRRASALRPGSH